MRWVGLAFMLAIALPHFPIPRDSPVIEQLASTNTVVRFEFTDGSLADAGGRLVLRSAATVGGELTLVPREDDWAVGFPAVCGSTPKECPRVILESDQVDWLNPGTRRLSWGASVQMAAHQVSDGANIVQKGLSAFGTQFKLQIDGGAGHPSCVMAGELDGAHRIFRVLSSRGIADGAWHEIECERDGATLRLLIDGQVDREATVPATLSIVTDLPLRVGGKGIGLDNDQFHGLLDNVFVEIG